MSGRTGPSGPLGIVVPPPPPPPVALYVPETLLASATDAQFAAVSQVQVRFAAKVSALLTEAYAEIAEIFSKRD